jgi:hypothetical protein
MCFNPSPERRVPSPNRYMAFAKFCFCKNNKRTIINRLPRLVPQCQHLPLRGPAPQQGAPIWRLCANWSSRNPGEQMLCQRRCHSSKSCLCRRRRPPTRHTLHVAHAQAQTCCSRQSQGRNPVLCTLHVRVCASQRASGRVNVSHLEGSRLNISDCL